MLLLHTVCLYHEIHILIFSLARLLSEITEFGASLQGHLVSASRNRRQGRVFVKSILIIEDVSKILTLILVNIKIF